MKTKAPVKRWLVKTAVVLVVGFTPTPASAAPPVFEKDILPIFQARCFSCHGPDKHKAGLDLRTRASILKGGETGPAINPGSAAKSLLWEKITANQMPPDKVKLSDAEKAVIRAWLDGGANSSSAVTSPSAEDSTDRQVTDADRLFWAFQPPQRPAVPGVQHVPRVRNPIDAFILAALEKKGLTLAPEADRLTLLRRASFDLIGLPPSPQDIEAFLGDQSPNAYERLIDRLLASEHYGERWGRHWLDLAGYADSEGILDADYVRSAAWRYRDYVIQAFNKDKPYDLFLKQQLAGDELVDYRKAYETQKELGPEIVESLIATGYLRCASDTSRPDFVNIKNAPGYYYQTLDDTLKIVASSTLGLTVQCAKCHSHKYDPIPQTDYYRMQAIFMSAYRPYQWVPQERRRLLEATQVQEKEARANKEAALAPLRKKAEDLRQQFAGHLFTGRLGKLPEAIREDVRIALNTEPAKRNEVQRYLAGKFEKELRPDPKSLDRVLATEFVTYKTRLKEIEDALRVEQAKGPALAEIRALYDLPGEAKTHLLRRGDYLNPGPEVQPGVLSALATSNPFSWAPSPSPQPSPPGGGEGRVRGTSGRRRAFAEWLTQPDHPLTARVLVNRLWLHHFGEGIVSTPDNFGHIGAPPSHPELLDWLATEVARRGWSIKEMHRLIMTSSTYRQASRVDPVTQAAAKQVDPDNRLLWRQRLRRLEAEVMRDTMLSVAGNLNPKMFGPPVPMQRQPDGEVITPTDASGLRRSVYLQVRRSQPLTLLQVFDQPVMETNCTRRGTSTVSSQALTLLNSQFLTQQAEAFAARVSREKPEAAANFALLVAFGRPPTDNERARFTAFLIVQTNRYLETPTGGKPTTPEQQRQAGQHALADFCQMLLSANELVYVD
jgi:hypothetical protein